MLPYYVFYGIYNTGSGDEIDPRLFYDSRDHDRQPLISSVPVKNVKDVVIFDLSGDRFLFVCAFQNNREFLQTNFHLTFRSKFGIVTRILNFHVNLVQII
jgi:hypothetical protein